MTAATDNTDLTAAQLAAVNFASHPKLAAAIAALGQTQGVSAPSSDDLKAFFAAQGIPVADGVTLSQPPRPAAATHDDTGGTTICWAITVGSHYWGHCVTVRSPITVDS